MKTDIKRQNFNITPEQEAEIERLREAVDAPSVKDAILWAVRVANALAEESKLGKSVYLMYENGDKERLLIPELSRMPRSRWKYLTERPHPWRRQLYVKGRRLPAAVVWSDMIANNQTVEQVAEAWELPVEAVHEIIRYCEENREILDMEADEEKRRLLSKGVDFGD